MTLTKCTTGTMDATSGFVERDYRDSEPVLRYLPAQAEAIAQRGVKVRCLFIVRQPEGVDPALLLRLCEDQRDMGIGTRVAALSELPPNVRRGTRNDFVIFDETRRCEVEPDLLHENAKTTRNAREDHLRQRVKRFRELWDVGLSTT
jgi:hypothetical protein